MATNFKAPPSLEKSVSYDAWLKEISIWQTFTDIDAKKQGPAVFLTLEGKARETVLELDVKEINCDSGVENIIKCLDKLYLKDKTQTAFETYEKFEKYRRPTEMTISDFINEFERLLNKTKQYGSNMSSDILAYRLLKAANLPEYHEQLTRATIPDLNYDIMKTQLKKIFGDNPSACSNLENPSMSSSNVKFESINQTSHEEVLQSSRYQTKFGRKSFPKQKQKFNKKGRNPIDRFGNYLKCNICESINHLAPKCPDRNYSNDTYNITLYQSNLNSENCFKRFTGESFGAAVLDSGASKTVCGKTWIKCYTDSLNEKEKGLIKSYDSENIFKFGDGRKVKSLQKVIIPAKIGTEKVMIETDVVNEEIPLLLSKDTMKKADTEIDFKNDSVKMLGQKQNLIITTAGHYAIPLGNKEVIEKVHSNSNINVTLNVKSINISDKKKIAQKLHTQFAHPTANKLIKLIEEGGLKNDEMLKNEIRKLSENCEICNVYRRPNSRPIVGLSIATEFNEVVAMDIKEFKGKLILHLIDHATRLSAAIFVPSKHKEKIISAIFKIWISVFGPPSKYFSDNGGEFSNDDFNEMCESLNIVVKKTAAESPFSNGLCERHNAVLEDMLLKVTCDKSIPLDICLQWVINAKNSLSNVHGFSPYQLVFGKNPNLPNVLNNKLPALEEIPSTEIIATNLKAIQEARKAFIQSESSEKLKRALRHNVRSCNDLKVYIGDSVYYKRNNSKRWKGPGKVLGQDGQQILIKHGSNYVRCHPCHVTLTREEPIDPLKDTDITLDNKQQDAINKMQTNNDNNYLDSSDDEVDDNQPDLEIDLNKNSTTIKDLKKHQIVKYRPKGSSEWKQTQIISRGGKASGIYKGVWNTQENENEPIKFIDFERDVQEFEIVDTPNLESVVDNLSESLQALETNVSEILNSSIKTETEEAKQRELTSWRQEEVYKEVPNEGQKTISTRWVITPKVINGVMSTKARLVARGFEEKEEQIIRSDSPTCLRESVRLFFSIAVSCGFDIGSIDIKCAFLQGYSIDRDIFIKPPREANSNKLWMLQKVVYGLCDASRAWYLRVNDEFKKLGGKVSKYDKAFYIWIHDNQLVGIMVIHVDDFIWAGNENFCTKVINSLKLVFKISKEHNTAFKYLGVNVRITKDAAFIDQNSYTNSLLPIAVSSQLKQNKDKSLNEKEMQDLRSIIGQINWLAGVSRPDLSFENCILSTSQSKATVNDLIRANKALNSAKRHEYEIKFSKLDQTSISLAVFHDASFGNLLDGGSQGGFIVFLVDKNGNSNPLIWASRRIKRVVKSTLAAETLSLVEAAENAFLLAKFIEEVLPHTYRLKITCFTDSKGLYDAVNTTNTINDKRLRIEMAIVREMVENSEIALQWIKKGYQLADVFTKSGASSELLIEVLKNGKITWLNQ